MKYLAALAVVAVPLTPVTIAIPPSVHSSASDSNEGAFTPDAVAYKLKDYAMEDRGFLPTKHLLLFAQSDNVQQFSNRSTLLNSTATENCTNTNPCLSICNGHKQSIFVLPGFTLPNAKIQSARVQYIGQFDKIRMEINATSCTYVPGIPGLSYLDQQNDSALHYTAALRAHFGCERDDYGQIRCKGFNNVITKVEHAIYKEGTRVGADLSMVDGYNVGASMAFGNATADNRTFSVYIPPKELKQICPGKNQNGEGLEMSCLADCKKTNKDKHCGTGMYSEKYDPSSKFLKQFSGQAYFYPKDDKYREFITEPVIEVVFGPQNVTKPKAMPEADGT